MGKIKIPPPPVNVVIYDVDDTPHPAIVTWDGYDPEDPETALWTATLADPSTFNVMVTKMTVEKLPDKTKIRVKI